MPFLYLSSSSLFPSSSFTVFLLCRSFLLGSSLIENSSAHCRVVEALLAKGPWMEKTQPPPEPPGRSQLPPHEPHGRPLPDPFGKPHVPPPIKRELKPSIQRELRKNFKFSGTPNMWTSLYAGILKGVVQIESRKGHGFKVQRFLGGNELLSPSVFLKYMKRTFFSTLLPPSSPPPLQRPPHASPTPPPLGLSPIPIQWTILYTKPTRLTGQGCLAVQSLSFPPSLPVAPSRISAPWRNSRGTGGTSAGEWVGVTFSSWV